MAGGLEDDRASRLLAIINKREVLYGIVRRTDIICLPYFIMS